MFTKHQLKDTELVHNSGLKHTWGKKLPGGLCRVINNLFLLADFSTLAKSWKVCSPWQANSTVHTIDSQSNGNKISLLWTSSLNCLNCLFHFVLEAGEGPLTPTPLSRAVTSVEQWVLQSVHPCIRKNPAVISFPSGPKVSAPQRQQKKKKAKCYSYYYGKIISSYLNFYLI